MSDADLAYGPGAPSGATAGTWRCGAHVFDLSSPIVMGIVNVTPDSFSDGGEHDTLNAAVSHAMRLVSEGAGIIDVGGESTRPGSAPPSVDEEITRTADVVRELASRGIPVSIDTRRPAVARAALDAGACIVNDVSGFRDPAMRDVLAASDAGAVVMHMQGEPGHMQDDPAYDDVVAEVESHLLARADLLAASGVARERICLDSGVGFGKRTFHNLALLDATSRLASHGMPLMVAVSRKSLIGEMTGIDVPADRDAASALCAASACLDGARIARVHDVAGTVRVLNDSRRAALSLGSNVGDGPAHLDAAIRSLRRERGVWVSRVSGYVRSEPAYRTDQPVFTNAAALVQTTLSPSELLDALHRIEASEGRVRTAPNAPRTLDIDIVDYAGTVTDDVDLTLPHPLARERAFVVEPLLEISPGHVLADGTPLARESAQVGRLLS